MADDRQDGNVDPRVIFAAERTLLAWIRTGIAVVALGFVVARFGLVMRELGIRTDEGSSFASPIGIGMVVFGAGMVAWSTIDHERTMVKLRHGRDLGLRRSAFYLGLVVAVGSLVLAGVLLAVPPS